MKKVEPRKGDPPSLPCGHTVGLARLGVALGGLGFLAMSRPTLSPLLGVFHDGDCYKVSGLSMGLKTPSDC